MLHNSKIGRKIRPSAATKPWPPRDFAA